MLPFELPFLLDPEYISLLRDNLGQIHSLYFSLQAEAIADARHKQRIVAAGDLADGLARLPGPRKYALLNSRFHCPADYFSSGALSAILKRIRSLKEASALDGIVYADHYLIQALSDADPRLCAHLEAVPSINLLPDSQRKILMQLEYLERTSFKPPALLVLDRSLNRSRSRLLQLVAQLRGLRPDMSIGLLANEGCLPECPFKLAHDAHISMANMDCGRELNAVSNQNLGCSRYFREDPSLMLRSPFIRPEDVRAFEGVVDFLKLSGRTRGAQIMAKVVRSYLQGSYRGNLLELMDTLESLTHGFIVPNEDLPANFFQRVRDCGLGCFSCTYCRDVADEVIRPQPLPIKPMWV